MQQVTDWSALWKDLTASQERHFKHATKTTDEKQDAWREKARSFDASVKRRWAAGVDSSRALIASHLTPDSTIVDIGAGTGAWAIHMARQARRVTAVEPSAAMIEVMRENLASEGITNVDIIQGAWPNVQVAPHDFALCSHAMYGCSDFPLFVRSMMAVARRTCFLVMRIPTMDGVMAEAAMRVWGQPHDSPNFVVGYNIMLQMGLFPNVLMEDTGLWDGWVSASMDEAVQEIKRKLDVPDGSEHEQFLKDLVQRRLTQEGDHVVWPRGVRSAAIYWNVNS
jgi:2-polyprenyl-3-methyl-5-hydroxy-6-metoxy-1,4-benzoquinol methylase